MQEYPITLEMMSEYQDLGDAILKIDKSQISRFVFSINASYIAFKEFYEDKFLDIKSLQNDIDNVIKKLTYSAETNLSGKDKEFKNLIETNFPEIMSEVKSLKEIQLFYLDKFIKENDNDSSINEILSSLNLVKKVAHQIESNYEADTSNDKSYLEYFNNNKSEKERVFIQEIYEKFFRFTGSKNKYNTDRVEYSKVSGPFFNLIKLCFQRCNIFLSDESIKKKISNSLKDF